METERARERRKYFSLETSLCFIDKMAMIKLKDTHFLGVRPHVDVDGEVSDLH